MLEWWSRRGVLGTVEGGVIAYINYNDVIACECQDGWADENGQVVLREIYQAEEFDYPGEDVSAAWAKDAHKWPQYYPWLAKPA
jgi:hypothetical protein